MVDQIDYAIEQVKQNFISMSTKHFVECYAGNISYECTLELTYSNWQNVPTISTQNFLHDFSIALLILKVVIYMDSLLTVHKLHFPHCIVLS
jgi:hypothetical protein